MRSCASTDSDDFVEAECARFYAPDLAPRTAQIIASPLGRQTNARLARGVCDVGCGDSRRGSSSNVSSGNVTDIVCVFQDVDFEAGGRYRAEDYPSQISGGDIHQETCTLELTVGWDLSDGANRQV